MANSIVAFKDQQRYGHSFVFKPPFFRSFLSFLKPVTAPVTMTINQTLGQRPLTLLRVVWRLPYYWLVLCANGGYWLASLCLRATLQHIITQPPPYKHGIYSTLGLRFKLYKNVKFQIHLDQNNKINERLWHNDILMQWCNFFVTSYQQQNVSSCQILWGTSDKTIKFKFSNHSLQFQAVEVCGNVKLPLKAYSWQMYTVSVTAMEVVLLVTHSHSGSMIWQIHTITSPVWSVLNE